MQPVPKSIGRYEILELVGKGGMGVLYRAIDPMLERDVALKMMHVDFTTDQLARERFQREAKAVARLQHKNVVTIHELGEVDGAPYIVMEFLTGKDLDAILRSRRAMTLVEKIEIAIQLCHGLGYAHEQGIVHRDIKPGNVRVLEDGTVKLLDFGIAKFAMSSMTQTGTVMGTPSYMAPEQIAGTPVDGRADLFSVGVLLYELLIGHKPFMGDSPTAIVYQIMHVDPPPVRARMPDLPEALNAIVSRALQKDPNDRYSRAAELAADLQMVKMSLDPPLKGGNSGYISGATPLTLGQLHATTLGTRTTIGTPAPALDGPMRGSVEEAAADAAPRGAARPSRKMSVPALILGAVAVAVVGFGIYLAVGGRAGETGPGATAQPDTPPVTTGRSGAPTPPPSPSSATFNVASVPAGASILLNGTDVGKVTPAEITVDRGAPATLLLSAKGYVPLTVTLSDADFKTGRKEFRLARDAGPVKLRVTAPFEFELVQGSRVISAAASEHDLVVQPVGPVAARNPDLVLNATLGVDFQRAQNALTLKAPGTISVFSAVQTCKVIVDDQDLGPQPIINKRIAEGTHTVRIKCPDGREDSQKKTVVSGELLTVNFGPPKG